MVANSQPVLRFLPEITPPYAKSSMVGPKLISPVVTPKDFSEIGAVLSHVFAGGRGADAAFILGTNGEFDYLTQRQKIEVIDAAVEAMGKIRDGQKGENSFPARLYVGATGNTLEESIALAQHAQESHADAVVYMPVFNSRTDSGRCTRRGSPENVETLLKETKGISVILYNHPGKTDRRNFRTTEWKNLAKHPRILALKDSSGEPKRTALYQQAARDKETGAYFAWVFTGDEINGLRYPSAGIVAGSLNILPTAWKLAGPIGFFGDDPTEDARAQLAQKLHEFQQLYRENTIGAFKYILHRSGVISSPETFNPEIKVSPDFAKRLDALIEREDFKNVSGL